jgi:pimeloyl-ACP methyl ester carboxylesterase
VIVFDKRGQGLSDRVTPDQTLEERIGDVRAVMDAVGSSKATIFGWSEGGIMSTMFAATYPERTAGLVLCGCSTSLKESTNLGPGAWPRFLELLEEHWGKGALVPFNAPSRQHDTAFVQWFGRIERASASGRSSPPRRPLASSHMLHGRASGRVISEVALGVGLLHDPWDLSCRRSIRRIRRIESFV